jgi:hypothetical protein
LILKNNLRQFGASILTGLCRLILGILPIPYIIVYKSLIFYFTNVWV